MTVVGGVWNHEGLSGVGWLAVALVIFCLWSPYRAIWGSILFGGLLILYLRMPMGTQFPTTSPDPALTWSPWWCCDCHLHAQQPRQAAAGQPWFGVFPRRAVNKAPPVSRAARFFVLKRARPLGRA